jgi:hypothetical protein
MGRLGRACLYASFVLSVSAASVLAASHEALPGEALYGLKLRVEQVRLEVLPEHFHDDVYADILSERLAEMGRLEERGETERALAMVPAIDHAYGRYAALLADDHASAVGATNRLLVLNGLIDGLPEEARAAIQGLIDRAGEGHEGGSAAGNGESGGGGNPDAGGAGAQGGPDNDPPGPLDAPTRPEATERPERVEKPEPSPGSRSTDGLADDKPEGDKEE